MQERKNFSEKINKFDEFLIYYNLILEYYNNY